MNDRTRLKVRLEQTFGKVPYVMMAANPPVSAIARAVYAALDWHGATIFPSDATVARMAGCSRRAVIRARKELEARGFLRRLAHFPGRVVGYVADAQPQGVVWEPMTAGHRLRHERERTGDGGA